MTALPLPIAATLIIGGAVILAVAGLLAVHRFVWRPQYRSENEVAGFFTP